MRTFLLLTFILFNTSAFAKEWKNLKHYQKATQKLKLSQSDWLRTDRLNNTLIWQNANAFNLTNRLSQEYTTINQRTDFYKWMFEMLDKKGHEVVWVKMAHFISNKLKKMESFPFSLFSGKNILEYVNNGNEVVFNNAFKDLNVIFFSKKIFKKTDALKWDNNILYKEQFEWINNIYITIDAKSLRRLQHIAKGKFLYSLVVHKKIRFNGNLSNPKERYNYALNTLRPYCENRYK